MTDDMIRVTIERVTLTEDGDFKITKRKMTMHHGSTVFDALRQFKAERIINGDNDENIRRSNS